MISLQGNCMEILLGVDNHATDCVSRPAGDGIYAIQCPGYLPGPGRLPGWGYVVSYLVLGADFTDKMLRLIDAFDPEKAESASWNEGDMASRNMRMFCFGRDFDDPDFVTLSFFMDQVDEIMK